MTFLYFGQSNIRQRCSVYVFFDEFGKLINYKDIEKQRKVYVLLAMAEKNEAMKKEEFTINHTDIELANKFLINQQKKDGYFHFDTMGTIFGLGYGPKYSIDEKTNQSIGQFAFKKK